MSSSNPRWPLMLAALWWGGITALSFVAVPALFAYLGNPAVAGPLAARFFQGQAWFSLIAALVLLVWVRGVREKLPDAGVDTGLIPWLLLAALAAMVQEFGVAQRILAARDNGADVRLWHSVGSVLVVLQWFGALRALWWLAGKPLVKSS